MTDTPELPRVAAYLRSGPNNVFSKCPTCGRSQMHSGLKPNSTDVFTCRDCGTKYVVGGPV
jgi:transposase-like protein